MSEEQFNATDKEHQGFQKMSKTEGWEKKLIENLAYESIREKRKTRRWGIFFKLLIFVYLFGLVYLFESPFDSTTLEQVTSANHTALIDIKGVISSDSEANADAIVTALREAFKDKKTRGIILRMNTPGGSPVQSSYVNDEIYRMKKLYPDIKVYAVISDVCASGGYYIAAAADEIYANKGSMVGSIGVLMDGFGFVEAIDKLGISRRLFTAGENKGFMDPFSVLKEEDVAHVKTLLANIHNQFIDVVKKGRGDKLKDDSLLFSGYIWTGEQAIQMGLVDNLGSSSYVAREIIGAEEIKDFTVTETFIDRFAKRLGASMAAKIAELGGFSQTLQLR